MWLLSAFLLLRTSSQYWQEYDCVGCKCFASIWYLTLVDLDWRPQIKHCHLPPPRFVIMDSQLSKIKYKLVQIVTFANILVISIQVVVQGFSVLEQFLTMRTRIQIRGGQVFGLNVIFDIGGIRLISTMTTLPFAINFAHHWLNIS